MSIAIIPSKSPRTAPAPPAGDPEYHGGLTNCCSTQDWRKNGPERTFPWWVGATFARCTCCAEYLVGHADYFPFCGTFFNTFACLEEILHGWPELPCNNYTAVLVCSSHQGTARICAAVMNAVDSAKTRSGCANDRGTGAGCSNCFLPAELCGGISRHRCDVESVCGWVVGALDFCCCALLSALGKACSVLVLLARIQFTLCPSDGERAGLNVGDSVLNSCVCLCCWVGLCGMSLSWVVVARCSSSLGLAGSFSNDGSYKYTLCLVGENLLVWAVGNSVFH